MTTLALGTVQFGLAYGVSGRTKPVSEVEVREILKFAHSVGIQRLDTAPSYGDIERRLIKLAGDLDFEIVSKIAPRCQGATTESVRNAIAQSVCHLGERLKGIIFHNAEDMEAHWVEAHAYASENNIFLGASYYDPTAVIKDASKYSGFAMAQVPGNAFDQRAAAIHLPDVEITLRSAFLQGLLLVPLKDAINRVPAAKQALARWHRWCSDRGGDPLVLALGLAKGLKPDYVVVGVDNLRHFEEILTAWGDAPVIKAPELALNQPSIIDPREWNSE